MTETRDIVASYDQAWEVLYGEENVARKAGGWFVDTFPLGHDTSLKPMAKELLETYKAPVRNTVVPVGAERCEFHPGALALLYEHGMDYFPSLKLQNFFRFNKQQPALGQCMGNSWQFMRAMNKDSLDETQFVYVEGLVYGYLTNPALHAWNAKSLTDTQAYDWTHYVGCEFSRYLGIPFTEAEYEALRVQMFPNAPRQPISLFETNTFPVIEDQIIEILASRRGPVL